MPTDELTTLVAQAAERWLGYRYFAADTDDDGHLITHGYWRRGTDFVDLPTPDGNFLLRLVEAMRKAGYGRQLFADSMLVLVFIVSPDRATQWRGVDKDELLATLRAASAVPQEQG